MYRNVVTEMSADRNGQTETVRQTETAQIETARLKSPVPGIHTCIPVSTMLQDNVLEMSKLLLTVTSFPA